MSSSSTASVPLISRRGFVGVAGTAGLSTVAGISSLGATSPSSSAMIQDTHLVHHVFFWLKHPDSATDLAALLEGIRSLGDIPEVKGVHVGVPADTAKRDVVEASYHASEILLFDSLEDQEAYQSHPLHEKFIADHAHRWAKVMVFDTVKA